ncbi:MBL fold metallo-hydrolase [Jannaschia sp. Os4]|nr:MBL fold metallo-hydrolase [Jannaschia sp. Os4]
MSVTWHGQSCVRLAADGLTVVTDPYTPEELGYAPVTDPADVALASSDDDSAHCRTDLIAGRDGGDPIRCNALEVATAGGGDAGEAMVGPLHLRAIAAEEWEHHPRGTAGQNAMYRFEMGGLRIAHMGDVGNALSEAQVAFFEDVDLLIAPTGGSPTIQLPDLMHMIHRMRPRVVLPVHFRTLAYRPANILWIEDFLRHWRDEAVRFAFGPRATLDPAAVRAAKGPQVLVLDYLRGDPPD